MRCLRNPSILVSLAFLASVASGQETGKVKERIFEFTYSGAVQDLKPGQMANVWIPLPQTTSEQVIELVDKKLPSDALQRQERLYGNDMLFFTGPANGRGELPFSVTYLVQRKEVKTDFRANLTLKPRADEPVKRFLAPDEMVPISGKPLDLVKERKLPANQFGAAREMYDLVNSHMKYSKAGKGWGRGDAVWACDSKFGNCTDFHSLFISLARGNNIPAKFEVGFPIPSKRGAGDIAGYHCWAWFLPDGRGWIPVDISEANRFPELKDYYFGNLTEDRVQFSTGRDINLEPRQKGAALNFFIYPYVEVDGQPFSSDHIRRAFSYKDVAGAR